MQLIVSYALIAFVMTAIAFSIAGRKADWRKCLLAGVCWPGFLGVVFIIAWRTK